MRLSTLLLALPLAFQAAHAEEAKTDNDVSGKILSQGVPAGAYKMLMDYIQEHRGQEFLQEVYGCPSYVKEETAQEPKHEDKEVKAETAKTEAVKGDAMATPAKPADKAKTKVSYREVPPTDPTVKPCDEKKRVRMTTKVKFETPNWVGIVDFSRPSTTRRFFLINLQSGDVVKYYVTHGKGSGNSNYATKFSNRKDSLQTSLGVYLAGDIYKGSYGDTLRLYGLQRSNDQAFNRDIVVHGAWYVGEDFINSINSQTKKKYGRLGVSWGCPALGLGVAPKIINLLKNGGMLLHYHPDLMEKAQTGQEVSVPAPVETEPAVTPQAPVPPAPESGVAETSSESKTSAETAVSN